MTSARSLLAGALLTLALGAAAVAQDANQDVDAILDNIANAARELQDASFLLTGKLVDVDGTEIALEIGADLLVYQEIEALKRAVRGANPRLSEFDASCFDGRYVTGDITANYLSQLADDRDEQRGADPDLLDQAGEPRDTVTG